MCLSTNSQECSGQGFCVNSTCVCNPGNTGADDFFSSDDCQINETLRSVFIGVLTVMSIICIICSFFKLLTFTDFCRNSTHSNPKRKFYLSNPQKTCLLVTLHYVFVLTSCALLSGCRMNQCLSATLMVSLSIIFGCINESQHLLNILTISTKSISNLSTNRDSRRLQKFINVTTFIGGIGWMVGSITLYHQFSPSLSLEVMWMSVGFTNFFWSLGFFLFGRRLIKTLESLSRKKVSDSNSDLGEKRWCGGRESRGGKATLAKIKSLVKWLTFLTFGTSLGCFFVPQVYWVRSRTIYFYTVLGSLLSISDIVYIRSLKSSKRILGVGVVAPENKRVDSRLPGSPPRTPRTFAHSREEGQRISKIDTPTKITGEEKGSRVQTFSKVGSHHAYSDQTVQNSFLSRGLASPRQTFLSVPRSQGDSSNGSSNGSPESRIRRIPRDTLEANSSCLDIQIPGTTTSERAAQLLCPDRIPIPVQPNLSLNIKVTEASIGIPKLQLTKVKNTSPDG